MPRAALCLMLGLALALAWSAPALAGETVDGDGYSLRLPDGFEEALSVENSGQMRIRSSFGTLPVSGVPEMKVFTRSGGPGSTILIVARVDLSHKITASSAEVAQQQLDQVRAQLPPGSEAQLRPVGQHTAVELRLEQEAGNGVLLQRVLSVIADDYCVVVLLQGPEEDESLLSRDWAGVVTSVRVESGINKLLLLGLVGGGGILALWLLSRVSMRKSHEEPEYTGRFKRFQDADTGPGFPPREAAEVGRRPKVLQSRPPSMTLPGPTAGPHGPVAPQPFTGGPAPAAGPRPGPAPAAGGSFASDGTRAPVRTPTSPAVTRPAHQPAAARPGLRSTLPSSGRWGE